MRCHVQDDDGHLRDLSPLISNSSYQVMTSNGQEFFINVCTDADDKCPLGSSSCLNDIFGSKTPTGSFRWSQISFHSTSQLVKHEYIELIYKSRTSKCNGVTPSVTKIRFTCPDNYDSSQRVPLLVSNLDCEYEIEWFTDLACSPKKTISRLAKDQCDIDGEINLNVFKRPNPYEIPNVNGSDNSIFLNMCSSNPKCGDKKLICVYNKTDSTYQPIGDLNKGTYVNADHRIMVVFRTNIQKCNGNDKPSQTTIEFQCDPSIDVGQPELVYAESCDYFLRWRTKQVCPLLKPNLGCSLIVNDPFAEYDLSPLTSKSTAYAIKSIKENPTYKISKDEMLIFSVCGHIPATRLDNITKTAAAHQACKHSSACLVNTANTNLSISLGHFDRPLALNPMSNQLELNYTDGFNPATNRSVTTVIRFVCGGYYNEEPRLMAVSPDRDYFVIEFNTVYACELHRTTAHDCRVHDPVLEQTFDLNPLRSPHYYTVKNNIDGHEFLLNICGSVGDDSCGSDVAICQKELSGEKRSFSLGKATSTFEYFRGVINMTFVGGSPYNDVNRTQRRSHISFICDSSAGDGHPEFDGEKDRAYFFRWYTDRVCPGTMPKITHCTYANESHYIDLSPLSETYSNHFAVGKNSVFLFNLCRPLPITKSKPRTCKLNSAVCESTHIGDGHQVSYGEPHGDPFIGFDSSIYLLYTNGDVCPSDPKKRLSARLRVDCDPDLVEPISTVVSELEQCTLELVARSSFACAHRFEPLHDCIYTDKQTGFQVNLNHLSKSHRDYHIKTHGTPSRRFMVNMCQPITSPTTAECKDAAVCLKLADSQWQNYGSANITKAFVRDSKLHVVYTDGSLCSTDPVKRNRSTEFEFICDHSAGYTEPKLVSYDKCQAKFQWTTHTACGLQVPSCSFYDFDNNEYYSLRQLSSLSHFWTVPSADGKQQYRINICKPLPAKSGCGDSAAICRCDVLQPDKSVVCNANMGAASDYDLTLKLNKNLVQEFEVVAMGECQIMRSKIEFICSNETGIAGPRLVHSTACSSNFEWKTIFACSHKAQQNSEQLVLTNGVVMNKFDNYTWNISAIFNHKYVANEIGRDNYTYVIDFSAQSHPLTRCTNAAICQLKGDDFKRNIGDAATSYKFASFGSDLLMSIPTGSRCGRNAQRNVTTKIVFTCTAEGADIGRPKFAYEGDDCEYIFEWRAICSVPKADDAQGEAAKRSATGSTSVTFVVFLLLLVVLLAFGTWCTLAKSETRFDYVRNSY